MLIRTKNGEIYDLESKIVSSWEYIDNDTAINKYGVEGAFYKIIFLDKSGECYRIFIDEKDILKQSNKIEELCDGFYLDIDNHPFDSTQIYDKDELQRALKEKMDWQQYSDRKYLEYEINLYAFIKTSKGLIFVAKMNNEDKSCLI